MGRYVFDIESDGLLDTMTKIYCICAIDVDTGEERAFGPQELDAGISLLQEADELIGHNIVSFDIPAIRQLYLNFNPKKVTDTLLLSQLCYPDLYLLDMQAGKAMPGVLKGRYSLEAWGYRLKELKGNFGKTTSWKYFTPEMLAYCAQDVKVNLALYKKLESFAYSRQALDLEQKFRVIMDWQERVGACFDVKKAVVLDKQLTHDIIAKKYSISTIIPDKIVETEFTPKMNNRKYGYVKGKTITRRRVEVLNPNSRTQLIKYFKEKYNWKPRVFTDNGQPKCCGKVLGRMEYPEAKVIKELFDLQKIKAFISGDNGWINIERDGRLHGRVQTIGCRTRRASHSRPNLGQVPSSKTAYGKLCRELFIAPEGWDFIGSDLKAIEIRMLGSYLYRYDGGKYIKKILEDDIHLCNMQDIGLDDRNKAKIWFFMWIYGGGPEALGGVIEPTSSPSRKKTIGKDMSRRFLSRIPAIKRLMDDVKSAYKRKGKIRLLDGGFVIPKAEHTAGNALIQGSSAVIYKTWTNIFWEKDYKGMVLPQLSVHDEQDVIAKEYISGQVSRDLLAASLKAGEHFDLKIPIEAESMIGRNWNECH